MHSSDRYASDVSKSAGRNSVGKGALPWAALAAVSCGGSFEGELGADVAPVRVAHPAGLYIADVDATGPGCPPGSWIVDISDDGETFTLVFDRYEVSVDPGVRSARTSCHIRVRLVAPRNTAFTVGSLYYKGFAFLESSGMQAEQTASYSFAGPVGATSEGRTALEGPTDVEYIYRDEIDLGRRRRSRCGRQGMLQIRTDLRLENDGGGLGFGYLNTNSADATIGPDDPALTIRLITQPCGG